MRAMLRAVTMKSILSVFCMHHAVQATEKAEWDWNQMTSEYQTSGQDYGTFKHFDSNFMAMLMGTGGVDHKVLHESHSPPPIGLSSMEKVTAMTSVSTRASIRKQLVDLLKAQVKIESMYNSKKEKLYVSASAVYNFISRLLHNACNIALSNDGLWKEQMQCFNAYKQLLEVYSMWNGVRDVVFALEHGIPVTAESLSVCGGGASLPEHFVGNDLRSHRLQNQYLVAATQRSCFDELAVRIIALRKMLSTMLVSSDTDTDRAQSCLFKVITVLTCLESGVQESILDLSIKEEHKQHVAFGLARYAATTLLQNDKEEELETEQNIVQRSELDAQGDAEIDVENEGKMFAEDSPVPQPQIPGSAFVETQAHEMPNPQGFRSVRLPNRR